jgi:hypothetical protein
MDGAGETELYKYNLMQGKDFSCLNGKTLRK